MKDFILDATNWQSSDDFYGGIFTIEAPFAIVVRQVNSLPFESDRLFKEVIALFAEARRDAEIEVEFRIS